MASKHLGACKDRTSNFDKGETVKLTLLLKEFPIITSKKTDHSSNQQKNAAWRSLAEKFNADALVFRNIKQLQQKFNNIKKIARKEMSAEKSGRCLTGGGPPPPKPSETTEWLQSIMGESISGLPGIYDSDALDDKRNATSASNVLDDMENTKLLKESTDSLKNDDTTQIQIEITEVDELDNTAEAKNIEIFDTSTPQSMLRKPVSKHLASCYKSKKKNYTPLETRRQLIAHYDSKTIYTKKKMAREEELRKYAQEEHQQNLKQKMELHQKVMQQMDEKHQLYVRHAQEIHAIEIELKKKQLNILEITSNK